MPIAKPAWCATRATAVETCPPPKMIQHRLRQNRLDENLQRAAANQAGIVRGVVIQVERHLARLLRFDHFFGRGPHFRLDAAAADRARDASRRRAPASASSRSSESTRSCARSSRARRAGPPAASARFLRRGPWTSNSLEIRLRRVSASVNRSTVRAVGSFRLSGWTQWVERNTRVEPSLALKTKARNACQGQTSRNAALARF